MNYLNMLIQALIYKSKEPISGYDITKIIESKSGNKHQQIYRELAKLAKSDDIEVIKIPQEHKPDKKVYKFNKKLKLQFHVSEKSDLRKTEGSYNVFMNDILNNTNNHDDYIERMSNLEKELIEKYKKTIK